MNALLEPARRIVRDLVDKKLWPVAVALLIAIVAVPVMLGGSSAEQAPGPDPVATTAASETASKSLITVVDQAATGEDNRSGKIDDPFYDPPAAADENAGDPQPTRPADAAKAATPAGTAAPTEPQTSAPAPVTSAPVYYRTVVRWYETTGGKPHAIARLTPFGGLVDTAALYLGVTRSSGTYAVFLLGATATSDGEARCADGSNCRVIGLKSGQSQIVTVQPADGSEARQYYLEVTSVKAVTTDAATAREMRLKVHPDGRDVMREMWQNAPTAEALHPIQYDRDSGLLIQTGAASSGGADAAAAAQAAG